jgi:hypothetical protein
MTPFQDAIANHHQRSFMMAPFSLPDIIAGHTRLRASANYNKLNERQHFAT